MPRFEEMVYYTIFEAILKKLNGLLYFLKHFP